MAPQVESTSPGAVVTGRTSGEGRSVRFNDFVELLPVVDHDDETDQDDEEERRWFSQAEIASFREEAIRTVQAANNACNDNNGQKELDHHHQQQQQEYCLRGLEKKMLKRPPPNFVKQLLTLQEYQKQRHEKTRSKSPGRIGRDKKSDNNSNISDGLATSLQLFSIACSKWARKRAIRLAAEDEFNAYQIFMEGLRKPQQQKQHQPYNNSAHQDDGSDDDDEDDEDDDDFDEEFDFCTEGDFVNEIYDYKHRHHDPTEDETEYDDSYDLEDCDFATVPCEGVGSPNNSVL